ncbi:MAG: DUF4474 domain-containing protein [Bacillota bacterium]|nr:DUF4474 domain-containing protein [Bacillota bacterium]
MIAVPNVVISMLNEIQAFREINFYLWIPISLACILVFFGIFVLKTHRFFPRWLSGGIDALTSIVRSEGRVNLEDEALDKAIQDAGYAYDAAQDIFYSIMNPWQRGMGYCRLYDEAAAPLGMIIDCEPIYFEYGGKKWLIEFWKGQYDLTTGCEIGIYTTEGPDLNIPGYFYGTFYEAASDSDRLYISLSLKKNGKTLFTRKDKHWWLTGFKLGEFSEPWELTINISITLKDEIMRNSFLKGLKNAGYLEDEIIIRGNTVSLKFDEARTEQPVTRMRQSDRIIQRKNELLCEKYQQITGQYDTFTDKMNAIKKQAPELYKEVLSIGKPRQLFSAFDHIKKYLK